MAKLELQHIFGHDLIWPPLTRDQIGQIKSVAKSDFTVFSLSGVLAIINTLDYNVYVNSFEIRNICMIPKVAEVVRAEWAGCVRTR